MTITVSRGASGKLEITNGNARLRAMLSLGHQVEVYDITSGKSLYVHEVGGELLAVDAASQALLDSHTAAAIAKAARKGQ